MQRKWEGRQVPTGDQAPLLVLIVVASLLVLMGFFVHGDSEIGLEAEEASEVIGATTGDAFGLATSLAGLSTTTTVPQLTHPIPDPSRIVIPAIGVDAPVVPVGLLADGGMETPNTGMVGWYSLGPVPGEQGPAVMIAHVDSYKSADVFYHLKELEPWDEITVYGAHGDAAVFVVEWVEEQLKIDLPRDRIWNYSADSLIRLITCGGDFDRTTRHYLSNVIAYGHLIR